MFKAGPAAGSGPARCVVLLRSNKYPPGQTVKNVIMFRLALWNLQKNSNDAQNEVKS